MGAYGYKAYAPWWFRLTMATINQLKNTRLYSVGEITGSTWLKPIFERGSSKSETFKTYQNIDLPMAEFKIYQNLLVIPYLAGMND